MELNKPLVNKQIILDLLYGDDDYFAEFVTASIDSFTEFKTNYQQSMRMRDLDNLRKAGHKIKPVVQMMQLNEILTMYERSKEMLESEAPDKKIAVLIKDMDDYCATLLNELRKLENS